MVSDTVERMESMVVNGLDVTQLTDDEVFQRLKDLGAAVGPIVDSTRSVYQRKLFHMLNGTEAHLTDRSHHQPEASATVSEESSEEQDELEEEEEDTTAFTESVHRRKTSANGLPPVEIRPSHLPTPAPSPLPSSQRSESTFEYSARSPFTPTARQPLHTGNTPSSGSAAHRFQFPPVELFSNSAHFGRSNGEIKKMQSNKMSSPALKKTSPLITTLFEVFVISFLVIVGYIFYQEVRTYSDAEQEFLNSNAQNFPST